MVLTIDDLRAIQSSNGAKNRREVLIRETKRNLSRELVSSLHYEEQALRNGIVQPLVVTSSQSNDECDVFAMPDEDLLVGDIIDCYSQKWIVIEVIPVNTLQLRGKMKLCNHLFRFQSFDGEEYERWGVLDPGVYSTTQKTSTQLTLMNAQYKVFLPYDSMTKTLYVDKRFSTGLEYDKNGNQILTVYRITRIDGVSESWGNGKLLVAYVKSDTYNPKTDDLVTGICDKIDVSTVATDDESGWY